MSLNQTIVDDLKAAMRARDDLRVSCLRMLKTSLKNKEVEKGRKLEDGEIIETISSMVRKGREAAKEYRDGGREDLASKEEQEIDILQHYLPRQLSRSEIEAILKEIIAELPEKNPKYLGKVMKTAMGRMSGQAEGKEVNQIARELLG